MFDGLLTTIVFVPVLAAVAIALFLRGDRTVRLVAAGGAFLGLRFGGGIYLVYLMS